MALVGYSDSEESDAEVVQPIAPSALKRIERADGKKIKVDLSSLQHGSKDEAVQPAAKRQKTGGAFSGFNSLLPPPKRTAQTSIKPGVSLRTSSEAAFSRVPPPTLPVAVAEDVGEMGATETQAEVSEPVLVGKTTRFMPLSVANSKKKKKRPPEAVVAQPRAAPAALSVIEPPKAKPKQSLFSVGEHDAALSASTTPYQPEFVQSATSQTQASVYDAPQVLSAPDDGALQGVATDLNLSESDRRKLFGRGGRQGDVQVAHFDMNAEYTSNQILAARGDAQEHRAVKAIAPGRHSLQQLVNNVQGQTEAIEEKWAEGRRARGETGSKYGW